MQEIKTINDQLIDLFGIDTLTGIPIWRIVWSEEQREKRKLDCTPSGIQLLHPMVFEVPKYPYVKDRWVLERLVVIPEINQDELPASKLSYEPMFVFYNENGDYIVPVLRAVKFIIDTVYAVQGKSSMNKYVEDAKLTTEEGRQERITELEEELFGNETDVGDALAYREGVIVPSQFGDN